MSESDFDEFFRTAFGKADDPTFQPFDYQRRLARSARPAAKNHPAWNGFGTNCAKKFCFQARWDRICPPLSEIVATR